MKLAALAAPPPDYNHEEKGDALYSMEIALALEKLNFQMLYSLHDTAEAANDSQFQDFVEEMLSEQVKVFTCAQPSLAPCPCTPPSAVLKRVSEAAAKTFVGVCLMVTSHLCCMAMSSFGPELSGILHCVRSL